MSERTLREAVTHSLTAEFTTVRDDCPATVPLTPLYDNERDLIVATAPVAFARKAERAATNPKVGILLHGPDDLILVTGTATVRDDDLEANSTRIERLIEDIPPSKKRDVLLRMREFLQTRLGWLLLDWYSLRILIEIEPASVATVNPPTVSGVGAWHAARIDDSEAATYDRAVASVVTADNWPWMWPLDRTSFVGGTLRLSPPADVSVTDGQAACVLCHGFSGDLHDITLRLVRGRLRERTAGVEFDPASSFRLRNETVLDFVRFVIDGKYRTRRYFRQRGESYRGIRLRGGS